MRIEAATLFLRRHRRTLHAREMPCLSARHEPAAIDYPALASRTTAPEQSRWPGSDARQYKPRATAQREAATKMEAALG